MHLHDTSTEVLTQAIVRYAVDRVRMEPPLDAPRTPAELALPAPVLGEHSAAVLAEAGFTADEIATLQAQHIISTPETTP